MLPRARPKTVASQFGSSTSPIRPARRATRCSADSHGTPRAGRSDRRRERAGSTFAWFGAGGASRPGSSSARARAVKPRSRAASRARSKARTATTSEQAWPSPWPSRSIHEGRRQHPPRPPYLPSRWSRRMHRSRPLHRSCRPPSPSHHARSDHARSNHARSDRARSDRDLPRSASHWGRGWRRTRRSRACSPSPTRSSR